PTNFLPSGDEEIVNPPVMMEAWCHFLATLSNTLDDIKTRSSFVAPWGQCAIPQWWRAGQFPSGFRYNVHRSFILIYYGDIAEKDNLGSWPFHGFSDMYRSSLTIRRYCETGNLAGRAIQCLAYMFIALSDHYENAEQTTCRSVKSDS
ncbi:hypothetical protein QQF64_023529, partial [Cirrhinus molitorella]